MKPFAFSQLPEAVRQMVRAFLQGENLRTPVLLFSARCLLENIHVFREQLRVDHLFFPVKTNNHPDVLGILQQAGVSFEIASLGELEILRQLRVPATRILFGNPIKIEQHIALAAQAGVRTFAADTESELVKIERYAPGAEIYLRLAVSNRGAQWELSEKFGCPVSQVVALFQRARDLHLQPVGISFHVGWNNTRLAAWEQAVKDSLQAIEDCRDAGIPLRFLNIGGGFPAHLVDANALLQQIAHTLNPFLTHIRSRYGMEIYAEPGSFLTDNAGIVVTRVIGVVQRERRTWVYVDTGINQGFQWIMGGLEYAVISLEEEGPLAEYVVSGPTCDSHDVFSQQAQLGQDLKVGDFLLIYPAGAYVTSAKTYNGFDYPEMRLSQ
ncbi:MAG: type III PLP-dependent enzyme [Anaerolineae bacterium]|nr:type III PLP-dependent enzyme [Anaerolineae bacterium]